MKNKHQYYHCERLCKVRVNANFANEQFLPFLGTLQPPPEIIDLQMAMMEVLFKAKECDRDQQLFFTGEMDADSYKRLKTQLLSKSID